MFKQVGAVFIVILLLAGCNPPGETQAKANEIRFQVKATPEERAYYPDGIIPWISIEHAQAQLSRLLEADKVVIRDTRVIVVIDYPLHTPVEFELTSTNGFTRAMLANAISEKYKYIYEREQQTTQEKVIPPAERQGLLNRNETNGEYGIWGHDITDLDLSAVIVTQKNHKTYLELIVES